MIAFAWDGSNSDWCLTHSDLLPIQVCPKLSPWPYIASAITTLPRFKAFWGLSGESNIRPFSWGLQFERLWSMSLFFHWPFSIVHYWCAVVDAFIVGVSKIASKDVLWRLKASHNATTRVCEHRMRRLCFVLHELRNGLLKMRQTTPIRANCQLQLIHELLGLNRNSKQTV